MALLSHVQLMAEYNEWMNDKVYAAAASLPATEVSAERGAFFGSILGTLNHLVVADTIWLQRFAALPSLSPACRELLAPVLAEPPTTALDARPFADLAALRTHRQGLDQLIRQWVGMLSEDDLTQLLAYRSTKGVPATRQFFSLLMHFFNHQTHHRGQTTTLLSQAGVDVGVTDLLVLVPTQDSAPTL